MENIQNKKPNLILLSKSPRRKALLTAMGFEVKVQMQETEEIIPRNLSFDKIPVYLAEQKADSFDSKLLSENEILLAADTLVFLNDKILGKPNSEAESFAMLSALSGEKHQVITGVVLKTKQQTISFSDTTAVYFKKLNASEIKYYIENYKPFDKAGSYGIQEWIGLVGVEKIEGSYFNVMGLPTHQVYTEILKLREISGNGKF